MKKTERAYGAWASPLSAAQATGQTLRFGQLAGDGAWLYWSESRPDEAGRVSIMRANAQGDTQDLLPAPYSARSSVHEYGGGAFALDGETVYFVNAVDQAIYRIDGPQQVSMVASAPARRFADLAVDRCGRRLMAVCEDHADNGPPTNLLATISVAGADSGCVVPLADGRDFYASPRIDREGRRIAWLEWSLPDMPWDGAALHVGELTGDGVENVQRVAGGDGTMVFQPQWTADGKLVFIWDRSGWGLPHLWHEGEVRALVDMEAEFARPQWVFDMRSYAVLGDGRLFATFMEKGAFGCGLIDPRKGGLTRLASDGRGFDNVVAWGDGAAAVVARDLEGPAVCSIAFEGGRARIDPIRPGAPAQLGAASVAVGEPAHFGGAEGGAHGLYYPPTNERFSGPAGDLPPAIIMVHGGPTGYADRGLKARTQYWTSRGFAVLDVDFAGSFGYGRAYREALNGAWGTRDVDDVVAAARWLVDSGRADGARIAIAGGSSGGYTVLCALADHDVFAAGVSSYGICDMAALARTTHKFESGYISTLTGIPQDAPEGAYAELSPLLRAGAIRKPVLLFQGLKDAVVPPEQSRAIARALRANGVPAVLIEFADEGHGFRGAQALVTALLSEHAFYAKVFGLAPADELPELNFSEGDPAS